MDLVQTCRKQAYTWITVRIMNRGMMEKLTQLGWYNSNQEQWHRCWRHLQLLHKSRDQSNWCRCSMLQTPTRRTEAYRWTNQSWPRRWMLEEGDHGRRRIQFDQVPAWRWSTQTWWWWNRRLWKKFHQLFLDCCSRFELRVVREGLREFRQCRPIEAAMSA